jgi:hypothetical protein
MNTTNGPKERERERNLRGKEKRGQRNSVILFECEGNDGSDSRGGEKSLDSANSKKEKTSCTHIVKRVM